MANGLQAGTVDPTAGVRAGAAGLQQTIKGIGIAKAKKAQGDREAALAAVGLSIKAFSAGAPEMAVSILEGNSEIIDANVGDIGFSSNDLISNIGTFVPTLEKINELSSETPNIENRHKYVDALDNLAKLSGIRNLSPAGKQTISDARKAIEDQIAAITPLTQIEKENLEARAKAGEVGGRRGEVEVVVPPTTEEKFTTKEKVAKEAENTVAELLGGKITSTGLVMFEGANKEVGELANSLISKFNDGKTTSTDVAGKAVAMARDIMSKLNARGDPKEGTIVREKESGTKFIFRNGTWQITTL